MELFSIWTDIQGPEDAEQFYQMIRGRLKELHIPGQELLFSYNRNQDSAVWRCSSANPAISSLTCLPRLIRALSSLLADYMEYSLERPVVSSLIRNQQAGLEEEEYVRIEQHCMSLLHHTNEMSQKRHHFLMLGVESALRENAELHLKGLLRFRLQAYKLALQDLVDFSLEEFWADRQYEEFMGLLKYFVFFQESMIPLVHVIHQGASQFTILDAKMEPVSMEPAHDIIVELPEMELGIGMEEMIVSSLISISPARILLYTDEPGAAIIQTVLNIFENKVEIYEKADMHKDGLDYAVDYELHLDGKEWGNYNNC
ncbi:MULTISPECIES: putative sporulation protein YtxC [Paenibacillus]|uniref:putative sporulation protein YtxC n=1 Tax=Paenibacillus TaxID=44249 RepID=UPI000367CF94|nr:putative sporulation protein YtxC [Paenibacillus massiliensis]